MQRVKATEKPVSLNIHRVYFSGYDPLTYMIQRAINRTRQWRHKFHYRLLANQIVSAILFLLNSISWTFGSCSCTLKTFCCANQIMEAYKSRY